MVTIEFSGNSDVFGHKVACFYKGKHSWQDVQALLKEGNGDPDMLQYTSKVLRGLSQEDLEKLGGSPASASGHSEQLVSDPVVAAQDILGKQVEW
eukprot:5766092-Amphidinium_carterae.1